MRRLTVFVAVLVGLIVAPTAAFAATSAYPPPPPPLTVSSTTITAGGAVTISGTGMDPNETVAISVTVSASGLRSAGAAFVDDVPPFTVQATAAGTFTASVTLNTTGVNTITATGQTSGRSESVQVTVTAPASTSTAPSTVATVQGNQGTGGGGNLSYTGTNRDMIVFGAIGGVLAIIIGGGLIWLGVSRRARRQSA